MLVKQRHQNKDPCYVACYIQSKNSGQENKIVERTKQVDGKRSVTLVTK